MPFVCHKEIFVYTWRFELELQGGIFKIDPDPAAIIENFGRLH